MYWSQERRNDGALKLGGELLPADTPDILGRVFPDKSLRCPLASHRRRSAVDAEAVTQWQPTARSDRAGASSNNPGVVSPGPIGNSNSFLINDHCSAAPPSTGWSPACTLASTSSTAAKTGQNPEVRGRAAGASASHPSRIPSFLLSPGAAKTSPGIRAYRDHG